MILDEIRNLRHISLFRDNLGTAMGIAARTETTDGGATEAVDGFFASMASPCARGRRFQNLNYPVELSKLYRQIEQQQVVFQKV